MKQISIFDNINNVSLCFSSNIDEFNSIVLEMYSKYKNIVNIQREKEKSAPVPLFTYMVMKDFNFSFTFYLTVDDNTSTFSFDTQNMKIHSNFEFNINNLNQINFIKNCLSFIFQFFNDFNEVLKDHDYIFKQINSLENLEEKSLIGLLENHNFSLPKNILKKLVYNSLVWINFFIETPVYLLPNRNYSSFFDWKYEDIHFSNSIFSALNMRIFDILYSLIPYDMFVTGFNTLLFFFFENDFDNKFKNKTKYPFVSAYKKSNYFSEVLSKIVNNHYTCSQCGSLLNNSNLIKSSVFSNEKYVYGTELFSENLQYFTFTCSDCLNKRFNKE